MSERPYLLCFFLLALICVNVLHLLSDLHHFVILVILFQEETFPKLLLLGLLLL